MQLVMAFDTDDNELVGSETEDKIPIYGISQIKEKIAQEDIKTAILTVPSVKAQEVAELLVDAGIEGILCFSPVNLNLPRHVVVQYVDLTSELQQLICQCHRSVFSPCTSYGNDQLMFSFYNIIRNQKANHILKFLQKLS